MPAAKIFPNYTLEESLVIPKGIFHLGEKNEVRRLTVFNYIEKAPESGPSRTLISSCKKYGLINGNSASEHLSVTELGAICVDNTTEPRALAKSLFQSGIESIEIFKSLFEKYVGSKMPARQVLLDNLKALKIEDKHVEAVADRFIENCHFAGVVKVLSGSERIIPIEQVIEEIGVDAKSSYSKPTKSAPKKEPQTGDKAKPNLEHAITPELHIDIQVHISPDSTPEQIDQIFASMAKHLYSKSDS